MKRRSKALLLSALVFPGAGHLFLKHYLRGATLMGLTAAGLAVILVRLMTRAMVLVEDMQKGGGPLDPQGIAGLLANSATGAEALLQDIATYGVAILWIIGMVDSYRLGKASGDTAA